MTTPTRTRGRTRLGLALLLLSTVPGCGTNELESPTALRLKGLAALYLDYAVGKNGKGPADEQVFQKHLRSLPGFVLEMNKLDPNALDKSFMSARDDSAFVVQYGVTITQISGTSAPLIAHEKTGKNGKRLAVFANAKVELVNEARLQELTPAGR